MFRRHMRRGSISYPLAAPIFYSTNSSFTTADVTYKKQKKEGCPSNFTCTFTIILGNAKKKQLQRHLPNEKLVYLVAVCVEKIEYQSKMKHMGILSDDKCPICDIDSEMQEHLFFQYAFNLRCMDLVCCWIGLIPTSKEADKLAKALCRKRGMSKFRKHCSPYLPDMTVKEQGSMASSSG